MTATIAHIDFDQILEIIRRGVRRADVFLGVGLNASAQDPPISHILAQDSQWPRIRLVKQELNDQEKKHVAEEFGKWVRANGLRELLETFSVFLHRLYGTVFLIKRHQQQLDKKFNKCRPEKFERMSIGAQIERMSEIMNVSDISIKVIRSLNKARNCYAHRNGVVGELDFDDCSSQLNVVWIIFQPQVKEPDGNVVSGETIFRKTFAQGGSLQLRVAEQSRAFSAGSELILEKNEMKEICFSVLSIGQSLFNETVAIAKGAGILVEEGQTNLDDPRPI